MTMYLLRNGTAERNESSQPSSLLSNNEGLDIALKSPPNEMETDASPVHAQKEGEKKSGRYEGVGSGLGDLNIKLVNQKLNAFNNNDKDSDIII